MKSNHQITLAEVASLAHVSSAAAGKILNGNGGTVRVGPAARERILAAAKELNYHPNLVASILAGGQSKLIGLLLDADNNYRGWRLLKEIESSAAARGYRLLTSFTHNNIKSMIENYDTMQRYHVTGMICCAHDYPHLKQDIIDAFSACDNIIFMERPFCAHHCYVGTSRTQALTVMIAQALRQGFARIGLVCGNPIWQSERTLLHEFEQALKANGLPVNPQLIASAPDLLMEADQKAQWVMEKTILPHRPDFLYVDDANTAAALLANLHEKNLKLKLHGGDGNPLFKAIGIQSLDPNYEKIAEALVHSIILPMEQRSESTIIATEPSTSR